MSNKIAWTTGGGKGYDTVQGGTGRNRREYTGKYWYKKTERLSKDSVRAEQLLTEIQNEGEEK
tara:strand:+ start:1140 stop:1328 length:189 start_codon:yes stop_codon:yes gene_type:complete